LQLNLSLGGVPPKATRDGILPVRNDFLHSLGERCAVAALGFIQPASVQKRLDQGNAHLNAKDDPFHVLALAIAAGAVSLGHYPPPIFRKFAP
jgi:hypothetical protein